MKSIIEFAELVDVLLIFPGDLGLRSCALLHNFGSIIRYETNPPKRREFCKRFNREFDLVDVYYLLHA